MGGGSHVRVMHEIAWLMRAWLTLWELGALRGKSLKGTGQLVLESSKHGIELFLLIGVLGHSKEWVHGDSYIS